MTTVELDVALPQGLVDVDTTVPSLGQTAKLLVSKLVVTGRLA